MSPGAEHARQAVAILDECWAECWEPGEAAAVAQVHATLAVHAELAAISERLAGTTPTHVVACAGADPAVLASPCAHRRAS